MKISIITVTKNNKAGLLRAIESVRSQTYKNLEHIIVDGLSTDGTAEAIYNLQFTINNLQFVSEADSGIYDAINKGIKLATGDVIGLLHSDDFYNDEFVLEKYAEAFAQSAVRKDPSSFDFAQDDTELGAPNPSIHNLQPTIDSVYSDLVYVMEKSKIKRQKVKYEHIDNSGINIEHTVIRYWKTQDQVFTTEAQRHKEIENGWMPPHPTLFIRKEIFEKYGLYRTDMKIASDYEMILRLFYKYKITSYYLPFTTYCMSIGGASNKSLQNIITKSSEDYRAMKLHSLPFPVKTLLIKNFRKLPQFFKSQK
jgi:glycosyltransferase